jgi:pilus assembly protein CpaF
MKPDSRLVDAVRSRLAHDAAPPSPAHIAAAVRAEGGILGDAEILEIARALGADLAGAGPLDPLLEDPEITDVLVNGPSAVWVDRGSGPVPAPDIRFADEQAVRLLAQRLAAQAGRRLDAAAPWVDARLPGGARFHAVLAPLAPEGTCLSLRLPRRRTFSMAELVAAGSITTPGAELIATLIAARTPFLICGGTGTGKTTLLSTLLTLVDPAERLILVEESGELRPEHPHVVRLEARPANIEGTDGVALEELVRQALRMRPDRIVVGEVRGNEVLALLNALNTGHEGGSCTLHANTASDVPARLEALGCGAGLSRIAVHSQLAATRAIILHVVRESSGLRRLAEVCVLARDPSGLVRAVPALTFDREGRTGAGPGHRDLRARLGRWWGRR